MYGQVSQQLFSGPLLLAFGAVLTLTPSSLRPLCAACAQLERHADELEPGFCLFQPAHAQLSEAQHVDTPVDACDHPKPSRAL